MFDLFARLAEILVGLSRGLIASGRVHTDADVADVVVRCATSVQDIYVRGVSVLDHAERLATGDTAAADGFARLMREQVEAITSLSEQLRAHRTLLVTIDPSLYVELVPFLDEKSGLLSAWAKQVAAGEFSTTAVFFLSGAELDRVLSVASQAVDASGFVGSRTDYLVAVRDGLRPERAIEVRDLRRVDGDLANDVLGRIAARRRDLGTLRTLSESLVDAMREALGDDAVATFRRRALKAGRKPDQR